MFKRQGLVRSGSQPAAPSYSIRCSASRSGEGSSRVRRRSTAGIAHAVSSLAGRLGLSWKLLGSHTARRLPCRHGESNWE